jgi:hypothetical protein
LPSLAASNQLFRQDKYLHKWNRRHKNHPPLKRFA